MGFNSSINKERRRKNEPSEAKRTNSSKRDKPIVRIAGYALFTSLIMDWTSFVKDGTVGEGEDEGDTIRL